MVTPSVAAQGDTNPSNTTVAVSRYRLNSTLTTAVPFQLPAAQSGTLLDFIKDPTISAECFGHLLKTYLFARY